MKNHAWFSCTKIRTRPETDKPIGHLQVPFCPIVWFILSQTNDSHIYTNAGKAVKHAIRIWRNIFQDILPKSVQTVEKANEKARNLHFQTGNIYS